MENQELCSKILTRVSQTSEWLSTSGYPLRTPVLAHCPAPQMQQFWGAALECDLEDGSPGGSNTGGTGPGSEKILSGPTPWNWLLATAAASASTVQDSELIPPPERTYIFTKGHGRPVAVLKKSSLWITCDSLWPRFPEAYLLSCLLAPPQK